MLQFLIQCMACQGPIRANDIQSENEPKLEALLGRHSNPASWVLCSLCQLSLVPAPKLCPHCASPTCPIPPSEHDLKLCKRPPCKRPLCRRPWIRHEAIQSFSALYLLLNSKFPVLRKWKTRRGLLFDRQILKPRASLLEIWKEFQADAIIPIPQSFGRAWKMRGSPTLAISRWVSGLTQLPIIPLLLPPSAFGKRKRQAELTLIERLQQPLRFSINPEENLLKLNRIILVDDFMTSGRTLNQAASLLKCEGIEKIHAFCLGIRTPRQPEGQKAAQHSTVSSSSHSVAY